MWVSRIVHRQPVNAGYGPTLPGGMSDRELVGTNAIARAEYVGAARLLRRLVKHGLPAYALSAAAALALELDRAAREPPRA
jgi:hypothetical protein